jgi:hypothetical protein
MSDGFLGRWSRRKHEARSGQPEAEPLAAPNAAALPENPERLPAAEQPPAAPPTLADAQALTPQSDFAPFVARTVAPAVRNAAMKQLFRDPHFNVMDGLDTYIDDYSGADPLPLATLRKMASAKFVGLVGPQEGQGDAPAPCATDEDPIPTSVAQSEPHARAAIAHRDPQPANASPTPHANAHLRLQSDNAAPEDRSGDGDR